MSAEYDYKIEVFIPEEFIIRLREEFAKVNVGAIGNYDHCLAYNLVTGYWRPLDGSNPYNGKVGETSTGVEAKVEVNCKKESVHDALKAIRRVHPYEEPLINIIPLANSQFEEK